MDEPLHVPEAPRVLQDAVQSWLATQGEDSPIVQLLARDAGLAAGALRVVACSTYLAGTLARYPEAVEALLSERRLERTLHPGELDEVFAAAIPTELDEADCLQHLRRLRHRELFRIAWRDLGGQADVGETLLELSALADAAIRAALAWSRAYLAPTYGTPRLADGRRAEIAILGMGKLGGRELNFSSDVDLVFLYTGNGDTDGRRNISNEQYFRLLAQRVVNLLAKQTADGFVYRVDTRLRPFGDSGPLAVSLPAFEGYLLSHGRDWERYAYVKARVINDAGCIDELDQEVLRPFCYRRYIDFGVFASLREMKALIEAEGQRREYHDNLKLGPGGIREVEFIAQSLQLVRGGTVADLRDRELQRVLPKLVQHQCLPAEVAEELLAAYRFLRCAENRLQAIADRQTHNLPKGELNRARLALAMNFADWDALLVALDKHRSVVVRHFRNIVFRGGEPPAADPDTQALGVLWSVGADADAGARLLEELGFADGADAWRQVQAFRESGVYQRMDESGRQRLDALMPSLLREAGRQQPPDRTLGGALRVVEAIGRRSAYFSLLNENPEALRHLLRVCALGDFLVQRLTAHPLLLDELIDPRIFAEPPGRAELEADLASRLEGVGPDDPERLRYALVNFQQAATFRVAVTDLNGTLPLMKISDRLTDIAELVLQATLDICWAELVARYGAPRCVEAGVARDARFAIVAYGKLGGLELGYGSDLDLVFLHDSAGDAQHTNGERTVDNAVFFARLTQRLISVLTLSTGASHMYEVDTRLRPSGRAGLLVSSLVAFDRYQREDAWTWEHQALLRSRAVAGDASVCGAFETLRRNALARYVRRDGLRDEVANMRQRMRDELSQNTAELFDLKQDAGGIADIEFIVQYLVLKDAHRYADLTEYSDNIRQLEALARNELLTAADALLLTDTYRDYRARLHRLVLAGEPALVPHDQVAEEADRVLAIWRRVFG
jgi:glutamate-ammonia-ligase adenylyltransferase